MGSVVSGTESVYTPLYHLLEQLGAGRKSTSALSRSSRRSGKPGRPCIVMRQNHDEDHLFPDICVMATFGGTHPSALTSLHRDLIIPVSPSPPPPSSSPEDSHGMEQTEIHISPPVEGGDGHQQWVVAFPYMASNPVKPRRLASVGEHTSQVSPESISLLFELSRYHVNDWQSKAQEDPHLIHRTFEEVQVLLVLSGS